MSLVRFLGYTSLICGCVAGRYRELASLREIVYIEEKGPGCRTHLHRQNHTIAPDRLAPVFPLVSASKAS